MLVVALVAVFALLAPGHAVGSWRSPAHDHFASTAAVVDGGMTDGPHATGARAASASAVHVDAERAERCGSAWNDAAIARDGGAQDPISGRQVVAVSGAAAAVGAAGGATDAPRWSTGTERTIRDCVLRR